MTRAPKVLNPDETYTFSKFFELSFDIEDILSTSGQNETRLCSMGR